MQATAEPLSAEDLGALLTEERAREIYRLGQEAVVFALLAQAKHLVQLQPGKPGPSTPSGSVPPYQKPTTPKRRGNGLGRKPGHTGSCRSRPAQIDQTKTHRLKSCRIVAVGSIAAIKPGHVSQKISLKTSIPW